jgi:uncharacterized protein with HEPN domain
MSRDYRLYLEDILIASQKILKYTKGIENKADFESNEVIYDAVLRNFGIIGEAMGQIDEEIRNRHIEVAWREIRLFRNIITHRYFSLNNTLIWNIVENQVGELEQQIKAILEQEQKSQNDKPEIDNA